MANEAARLGLFVVLDGVDGCGKSTQALRLAERLTTLGGPSPLHLREPGSTRVGEALRALLLDPDSTIGPTSETLLFASARAQMLEELVQPALEEGRHVVCERFNPSTFAYQAWAGGLEPDRVLGRGDEYLARVAEGYRRYAARAPRARQVQASADADTVAERIWRVVAEVLDARG
jgi:thymidylate kinase